MADRRLSPQAERTLAAVVGVAGAVVLLLGSFVALAAHRVHAVGEVEALARYLAEEEFAGLPGWNRPLSGPRPLAGVYSYDTTGSARVDRLGIDRQYPALTTRIVTHGPGCQWRETVPIFTEHVETYSACAQDGDQLDTGLGTRLVYFFLPAVTDLVCASPGTRTGHGLAVGQTTAASCADDEHDVQVEGTTTYLGPGTATVDGRTVACRRVRILTKLTGSNEGGAVRELCTTPDTGLVLTETRTVGIRVRTLIGSMTYAEEATFALRSLSPLV